MVLHRVRVPSVSHDVVHMGDRAAAREPERLTYVVGGCGLLIECLVRPVHHLIGMPRPLVMPCSSLDPPFESLAAAAGGGGGCGIGV